jgi:hypothetical protein
MIKGIILAEFCEIDDKYNREEITYSKRVELINDLFKRKYVERLAFFKQKIEHDNNISTLERDVLFDFIDAMLNAEDIKPGYKGIEPAPDTGNELS